MVITLTSPLSVKLSPRKQMILNLNNYRNLYYRTLNNAKIVYKEIMKEPILEKVPDKLNKIAIQYKVFKGDRRRFDIGNVCSVHQKFFEDAFVELGKLDDDRHENIPLTFFTYGGIDRTRPRVEITIYDLTFPPDRHLLVQAVKDSFNK